MCRQVLLLVPAHVLGRGPEVLYRPSVDPRSGWQSYKVYSSLKVKKQRGDTKYNSVDVKDS